MQQHSTAGPSADAFAGSGFGNYLKRAFFATRPKFFTASVLPVVVGTALGAKAIGAIAWIPALLAILATILVHAASNVLHDVGDDMTGADAPNCLRIYPFTGGSRFIQACILSRDEMRRLGIGLLVAAAVPGLALVAMYGPMVLWLGLAGSAIGLLYSIPPIYLSGRGVGELFLAVAFGPLPVMGAAWLQDGVFDLGRFFVSVPVGLWVAAILLINEVPDMSSDAAAGKRTQVVRLGVGGARLLYIAMHIMALAGGIAAIAVDVLPWWYALPAVALFAMGLKAGLGIADVREKREQMQKSIEGTLAVQALG
ncbi:MAG TPA: prenyltransferase, partial [Rubrivivax sp.]|nr:prenyltransferase [Rubrivivax sp.]